MDELFIKYNIKINEDQKLKFKEYYNLLIKYNEMFNITSITNEKDVYIKHFIDSILGKELLTNGCGIDIGAGGGFPSIPLKIVRDEIKFTLLEATGKKCEFLKTVVKELDLKNVEVIYGRAEIIAKDNKYREKYDFAVARAVARLNTLCEYTLPFVKVGGRFISYKGEIEEELKESQNAIKILGGKVDNVYSFELEGAKRNIAVIEKINKTDIKYPRGNGKERKNPL